MNETIIVGQEKSVEEILFLINPENRLPLEINYDKDEKVWNKQLDHLMYSRDKASVEKRIVILFMGGIHLALTIRLFDLYVLGINTIEAKDIEKNRFKTSFKLTREEISYSDTKDVEISRETLLHTMHYISKSLGLKELDVNCLKLLIFFTSEAARFETVRKAIDTGHKINTKDNRPGLLHWLYHIDILHNWKTLQDFLFEKKIKKYNERIDIADIITYIKMNQGSATATKMEQALKMLGLLLKPKKVV